MKKLTLLLIMAACAFTQLSAQECAPSVVVYNGVSVNMNFFDSDNDGLAESARASVNANDLVRYGKSDCNAYPLTFTIGKANEFNGQAPQSTSLQFNCDEVGIQVVQIWVTDANGNTNFTETYVNVMDSQGLCSSGNELEPVSTDCNADQIPPSVVVMNGYGASLLPNGSGNGTVTVYASSFIISKTDNCGGKVRVRIGRVDDGNNNPPTTNALTFECFESFVQPVEIWVGDESGNWDFVQTYVFVNDDNYVCDNLIETGCNPDLTPPDVLAYNGLAVSIPASSNGVVSLKARDFLRRKSDNCGFAPKVLISKDGQLVDEAQNILHFTCAELGTQFVNLWVQDVAGNWSQTGSYVIIQDNQGSCGNDRSAQQLWPEYLNDYMRQFEKPVQRNATREAVASVSPNPFNNRFLVQVEHPEAGPLNIALFDAYGKQLRTLANDQWTNAGTFSQSFDVADLPAGAYWCVVRSNGQTQTIAVVKN